jgi:hypothetical protein
MALVCAQCSRVNPPEAVYCYFDGAALAGRVGGPVNPGSAPFPGPFVFPNGQSCRNFDQLAMTCQHHWSAAVDLLKQGFLASFFGGLGRVDLALAAQEAAKFPDPHRGLDQLLAKLPTQVLEPPKLKAEPRDVNLGLLKIGEDRTTEIHLSNLGMRLVYGTVVSDAKWLTLGDAPGNPQKIIQFGAETVIPVHIRGQHLRAASKPLEGRLVVESSGGTATIVFRADVPVTPYPGGLFDGAITPRQIAEKAKSQPKDAAPYFEHGDVARWFASNGWTYPVQGPAMAGTGAVQQFFEALGVARPPKVDVSTRPLEFSGEPGRRFDFQIEVTSPEKKVVYGWASSDQPWIEAGQARLNGRSATIPLAIPGVPNLAGTHEARITVTANGNQKFVVPVRLAVVGGARPTDDALPIMEVVDEPAAAVATAALEAPLGRADNPFALGEPVPAGPAVAELSALAPAPDAVVIAAPTIAAPTRARPPARLVHAAPAIALALVLFALVVRDVVHQVFFSAGPAVAAGDVDTRPLLGLDFDFNFIKAKQRRTNTLSFGLVAFDPELGPQGPAKKLTSGPAGHTNSALLKIDGKEYQFGDIKAGRWQREPQRAGQYGGRIGTFVFTHDNIAVTQEVKLIPGDPVEVSPGVYKRVLDTCVIHYAIENRDRQAHEVGFRFILDTVVGDNDGAPFTIPGVPGLVDTTKDFKSADDVPDFIQVIENTDLKKPGLIAQLNLRLDPKRYEVPGRVSLTQHPQHADLDRWRQRWEVPLRNIKDTLDSCVVLYWEPKSLAARDARQVAFSYGLGNVTIGTDAKLGLTVGGTPVVGGELTVVALVADPLKGQPVRLDLPPGLELVGKSPASQTIDTIEPGKEGRPRPAPVTWRIRPTDAGEFRIRVETGNLAQERRITVGRSKLFN